MRNTGEAWDDLRDRIAADPKLSDKSKEKALAIIDSDINVGTKKWRMAQLPVYRYLLAAHYRDLRQSALVIVYSKPQIVYGETVIEEDSFSCEEMAPLSIDTIRVEPMEYGKRELFFLRTNLLVPGLNIGAEIPVGDHWSVGTDYYFPWFFRDPKMERCFQVLAWSVEGRYWFGKERTVEDRLEGHSLGLSAMGGYYDIERDYTGHQGSLWNFSIDYLFALPIFKDRMHLEFSLGAGYFISPKALPYDVFEEGGLAYKRGYAENIHWVGPNKASISLVVPIKTKGRGR